jgi:hypothetical protein
MKYILLVIILILFTLICFTYQEGFGLNNTNTSHILLLRQPNLDMINNFVDYSNNRIAFDISTPASLNSFINAYREVVNDIGALELINIVNRGVRSSTSSAAATTYTPSYLTVSLNGTKTVTMTSYATPPTYTFTKNAYPGDSYTWTGKPDFVGPYNMTNTNGIMLVKPKGSTAWTVLASEVSPTEICKIKSACT